MDPCALAPPNHLALSDTVIGGIWKTAARVDVVRQKYRMTERRAYQQRSQYRHTPYEKNLPERSLDTAENHTRPGKSSDPATLLSIVELIGQTDSSSGRKRQSYLTSDLQTANEIIVSIQGTKHNITAELQQAIVTEALKKKIRHRERCRVNQARYRNRQLKVEKDVQAAITKLQYEIEELEVKCKDPSRVPTVPTAWAIAAEYFRHFRYYISSPGMLQTAASTFLHGITAPDVMVNSLFGVEAQLANWKFFALYFDDAQVEMTAMKMPTSDTLIANTIARVTITSNTLRRAFPHLNSDGQGGAKGGVWTPLAARLLGADLVIRGSVRFGWDAATDKVGTINSQADMLTPMLNLLGSVEDVSCVFSNARITPDCRFIRGNGE